MAKQVSASNVAERTPVSKAASADVKGTHGMAVGEHLIHFLEEKAKAVSKVNVSLKEKLAQFYDFSDDDFKAYFATTKKWREDIAKEAENLKITVTQYRASAEGMDYVYVTVSEFDRLARAVQTGWRPEVDRLTWAAIKAEATARLDSVAKETKKAEIQAELAKWAAAPEKTEDEKVVKKANITILNKKMEEIAQRQSKKTTETKSNFQQACEMLDKFPLHDLELVAAWVNAKLAAINAKRPAIQKPVTGTDPAQKGTPTPKAEHAEASSRTSKKAKSRKSRK